MLNSWHCVNVMDRVMMCRVVVTLLLLAITLPSALGGEREALDLAATSMIEEEECERPLPTNGCTVTTGHAQCESSDFKASVLALPPCVTRLSFSLIPNPEDVQNGRSRHLELWRTNMSGLSELTEFSIVVRKESYWNIGLDNVHNSEFFVHLQQLRVLRIRARHYKYINIRTKTNNAIYKQLKHMQVLDLTRAKHLSFDFISYLLGAEPTVKTLILRNIQEFHQADTYSPNLDLSLFVCGGHVTYLDLSYNDIVTLQVKSNCWESNLKHLRADNNFLAGFGSEANLFSVMPLITRLESIHVTLWSGQVYQENLWQDDTDEYNVTIAGSDNHKTPIELSPVSQLVHKVGLPVISAFAGYDFWVEDFMKHCGDFSYLDLVGCYALHSEDTCSLFYCLVPKLNVTECQRLDTEQHKIAYITTNICSFKSCKHSMRFPLPPDLTTIVIDDFGKYANIRGNIEREDLKYRNKALCVHPYNNIQVVEIRNIHFQLDQAYLYPTDLVRITGLPKLRYLNIQGHKLPFPVSILELPDAHSLTELHAGGGSVTQDDFLPTRVMQTYPHLTLLNLSHAGLLGMESDVFQVHKNLSVLDLSHNRLNSSSLASVDFSQTKLRSLNLSHNQLSSLPESMRDQLDHMAGLELYLSGNGFICNCDNLAFMQWIQSSSNSIVFHYAGDHVCADSPGNTVHNIEIDSLHCDWFWVQPVLAVGCTLAVSLLTLAIYALYKKRWAVANLTFRFRERFCVASDDDTSTRTRSYSYDAYVLYSGEDEDRLWVHYKLVPELEKVYGFRLCIEHRDFLGGIDIVDNVEAAIQRSRKVLVIMSPNFLRSHWCLKEVQMTVNADPRKLIVIMYHDVLMSGAPIPPVVQQVLKTTYIEWDEAEAAQELFWKKTRRALYSKSMTYTEPTRPDVLTPDHIELI